MLSKELVEKKSTVVPIQHDGVRAHRGGDYANTALHRAKRICAMYERVAAWQ